MSADISSLPPWKQELLEKKRRHEEEERKKKALEGDRLSKMPPWKRDIILKKQQQKNSLVFIGKSELSPRSDVSSNGDISSPRLEDNYVDETDELTKTVLNHSLNSETDFDSKPAEEHLIPIQQNPWVRTEMHWKKSKTRRFSGREDENDINYSDHSTVPNHNVSYETDGHVDKAKTHNDLDEDIFTEPEEEVHYGRGFVDKLRQKFSHLSTNDRKRPHSVANINLSPKHSRSTDSILDEVSKPIPRSISTSDDVDHFVKASIFSPPKARSMENLLSEKTAQNEVHEYNDRDSQDLKKSAANIPKSASMGNDISNQLPTNDVEGVSGISYKSGDGSYTGQRGFKIRSSELYVEELPRANIVSATRTLFEGSPQRDGTLKRNISQEPVSHISNDHTSSNVLDNDYIHSDSTTNGVQRDALANHIDDSTHDDRVNRANVRTSDLPNHVSGGASHEQSQETLQGVRSTGKVWFSSGTGPQDTSPRSYDYNKLDKNNYHVDSRWSDGRSPRAAVTADNQRANLAYQYGSKVQTSSSQHADEPSSIINQKNQRNADLSLTFERTTTKDSIYSSSDSPVVKSPSWTKKRPAPEPPNEANTRKHAGFTDLDNDTESAVLKVNDSSVNKSDRTKLHLDFSGSQNEARGEDLYLKETTESSPSYRDLYFSAKRESSKSSSSSATKLNLSGTQESVVDDDDEHLLKKPSATDIVSSTTLLSESTDSGIGSDSTDTHSQDSGATSAVPVSEKHSRLSSSASNINNVPTTAAAAAAENKRPTPPNSLPENKKNISINLQGETSRRATPPYSINIAEANNLKNNEAFENGDGKQSKRPVPHGPGMLLIRPASNLVTGAPATNNQFLQITRYNDVKTGSFEPAKKRPNHSAGGDVPITNIDDMLDDVPVTNIDDMGYSPDNSPRSNEIDSDTLRRQAAKKYEFIGAEVSLGRSLLVRTRNKKVRLLCVW